METALITGAAGLLGPQHSAALAEIDFNLVLIDLNKKLIPSHILNQRKEFRKSIMIRDTYAETLNLLQADIMRKLNKKSLNKKQKETLMDAMIVTITGIAAAMKNTG